MPPITFVHALWGDVLVATWPKILRDIQYGANWRVKPDGFNRLVFAYGKQNHLFLKYYGLSPICVSRKSVVDFNNVGSRDYHGRGSRGVFNYGLSMWAHKSHAIKLAFEYGAEQVLWLDWDTQYLNRDLSLFDTLADGPEFQGRMRHYKLVVSGGGKKDIYHGGCYYMRSPRVFEEVDRIRWIAPYVTDESLVVSAVDNLFFGGKCVPPDEHRKAGFDNPQLHATRVNSLPSDLKSMYFEGKMQKSPAFAVPMARPDDEFRFYDQYKYEDG